MEEAAHWRPTVKYSDSIPPHSIANEDGSESDFASDSDDVGLGRLTASSVPFQFRNTPPTVTYHAPKANSKRAPVAGSSQDSDDEYTQNDMSHAPDSDHTDDEDYLKDDTRGDGKLEEDETKKGDPEKKKKRNVAILKEIIAVQTLPKLKNLKKNKRIKVVQQPSAYDWHLPMFETQPFPYPKKSEDKKKRKREDPARFMLQLTKAFEEGTCQLDECVFEDARGAPVSDMVYRKFTPRRIAKSLCKHLWNTQHWGVLTNARRRSLYETSIFDKRLRDRGASAAMLGTVVESLATTYSMLDFVQIWFTDGSEEPGLRLSQETFRIGGEKPHYIPRVYR